MFLFKRTRNIRKDQSKSTTYENSKPLSFLLSDLREDNCIVEKAILPMRKGRVKALGSWWTAISESPIPIAAGSQVEVIGFENTRLIVRERQEASMIEKN